MAGELRESKETWRGKVRGMTEEEMEQFLERGVNMMLACLKPDGSPYVTICWQEWRDGSFWVIPRQRSRWAEYLKADPRVSCVVEDPTTMEKVLVPDGRAALALPDQPGACEDVERCRLGASLLGRGHRRPELRGGLRSRLVGSRRASGGRSPRLRRGSESSSSSRASSWRRRARTHPVTSAPSRKWRGRRWRSSATTCASSPAPTSGQT